MPTPTLKCKRLIFFCLAFVLLGQPSWSDQIGPLPPSVRKALRKATPTQKVSILRLIQSQYPELKDNIYNYIHQKHPDIDSKVAEAALEVAEKHPGIIFGLPRHILQDTGQEGFSALVDVISAITEKYPNFPYRIIELRIKYSPQRAVRSFLARNHPELLPETLSVIASTDPGLRNAMSIEARTVIRDKHPDLPIKIALDLINTLQERNITGNIDRNSFKNKPGFHPPLLQILKQDPGLLPAALSRIQSSHGDELRTATIQILERLEKKYPNRPIKLARNILKEVNAKHPGLISEIHQKRHTAKQQFREAVMREFPELPEVIAKTLETKHPQLSVKVQQKLKKHYPNLDQEFWSALEAKLPGITGELRAYLDQQPRLWERVLAVLNS